MTIPYNGNDDRDDLVQQLVAHIIESVQVFDAAHGDAVDASILMQAVHHIMQGLIRRGARDADGPQDIMKRILGLLGIESDKPINVIEVINRVKGDDDCGDPDCPIHHPPGGRKERGN